MAMLLLFVSMGVCASTSLATAGPTTPPLDNAILPEECALDNSCISSGNTIVGMADAVDTTGGHHHHHHHRHHHKQTNNNATQDRGGSSGLKQASKGTESEDETSKEDKNNPLLRWLSDKMVPQAKACGVYLAQSSIPGAGLGMFAGRYFQRNEIVTEGDVVIPLSELEWHNGFRLDLFLWEDYTCTLATSLVMDELGLFLPPPAVPH
jgi:hypothetical protein